MSDVKPLPSMFGRFTAIFRDHQHLGVHLRQLRALCAAIEAGQVEYSTDSSPLALVSALRSELAEHFEAEESNAYFGLVLDEAPALAPRIGELKWEHLEMLRTIDLLCQLAAEPERLTEFPVPMRALLGVLERHEQAESALLRDLFRS
jgi:hypothetical protein